MSYNFFNPTRVLFGAGELNNLHKQAMPGKKAMVVISNGKSTRENGTLDRTLEQLRMAGVETAIFDKVEANPLKSTVEAGAKFAKDNGCDFVVALGGGSVMDAAKIMAMYALQPGELWDYVAGSTGKMQPLVNPTLPVVAITTTAGTGSEVDQWGVITNPETNEKIGCGGMDSLFPLLAVVDPELMLTVPPKFTAYQGFDALFHSVEGYISIVSSLMSDMVQLAAIENIGKYLPRAVKNGDDLEAREHVAFANTMSGYSMVVGSCTSEHSMEHAMSAYHQHLPHGAGLIMISKEYYTHFINKHCCDERFVRMAQALGKADAKEPMDFITALVDLQKACGVADLKMSDYGIQKDECMTLAKNARATMGGLFACDPVQMTDEECAAIYEKSYR
ncbi:MAG: iron-containing alcohol dehydrogenase [Candidatus Pseudoruminococcus sp.]|nr:iron-containing alcohol dehydrogenase [Ruminococcus sp.]MDY2781911.1 iron-containing alcohol dehydrogenase [Candidatus Pseudoruminococcus sp.]